MCEGGGAAVTVCLLGEGGVLLMIVFLFKMECV